MAYLAPEVRRALAAARQKGTTVDGIVTCGNLPDLRSLTMPLIEELDIEVETLDSLEGLVVKPALADWLSERASAIRLACAGAFARETRAVDESVRRRVRRGPLTVGLGAAAALAALGLAAYLVLHVDAPRTRRPASDHGAGSAQAEPGRRQHAEVDPGCRDSVRGAAVRRPPPPSSVPRPSSTTTTTTMKPTPAAATPSAVPPSAVLRPRLRPSSVVDDHDDDDETDTGCRDSVSGASARCSPSSAVRLPSVVDDHDDDEVDPGCPDSASGGAAVLRPPSSALRPPSRAVRPPSVDAGCRAWTEPPAFSCR